jgi:hypothetical protein
MALVEMSHTDEYRMSGLNDNKIKLTSSTVKFTGEIDIFSNTGPQKLPYMLSRSQYGHN